MKYLEIFENYDTQKTYTLNELPPKVIQEVLDRNRDINVDYDGWCDPIIEGAIEDLQADGFEDVKIAFSGFYSQGDGASFTGRVADNKKFLEDHLGIILPSEIYDWIYISVRRSGLRYYHEKSVDLQVDIEFPDNEQIWTDFQFGPELAVDYDLQQLEQKIQEKGQDWIEERSRKIYKDLFEYYEELQSDEDVKETIEANDYEFDIEGNIV